MAADLLGNVAAYALQIACITAVAELMLRILPVAGPVARNLSPRVGHLHITVDDLPWLWADFGQSNTIVLAGMPRGQHTVLVELVDAEGNVFTGQTVTFHSPGTHADAQARATGAAADSPRVSMVRSDT